MLPSFQLLLLLLASLLALIPSTQAQCASQMINGIMVPSASNGETVQILCAAGSVLEASASCSSSSFGAPSRTCTPISSTCASETFMNAEFPTTPAGAPAIGQCQAGYSGMPLRNCNRDGTWGTALSSSCVRNTCPAVTAGSASWPETNSLTTAYSSCQPGFSGTPARVCNADGTWGPITSPCLSDTTCPEANYNRAQWPVTSGGTHAEGVCNPGYSGKPSRFCRLDGTWVNLVTNICVRNVCEGFTDSTGVTYPSRFSFDYGFGTCPSGTSGDPRRRCGPNGNWESPFGRLCVANP